MQQYTTDSLRKAWLDFFRSKHHAIIPSAGVIPENDPTALFHNSGMHPLVPYLMGEPHPLGKRLANAQKCIRTGDIEEVGDATHLTFFEMLGNWSLGDFFKKEQIAWSYEFLVEVLKLPLERLAFSVFAGDENAPRDEEAAALWQEMGVPRDRIAFLPASENWWSKGETGPCGPDTEMFYWTGPLDDPVLTKPFQETWEDPRWVEIWNDVFMQFNRLPDGSLEPLPAKNVDTGMGLERTVAVLNGMRSVYQTDAFAPILEAIATQIRKSSKGSEDFAKALLADPAQEGDLFHSARVVADHLRSSTIILSDKVEPSNVDQGYILRRLIRRAIRHGRMLGIEENLCVPIAEAVIKKLGHQYPELEKNRDFILSELEKEEHLFRKTLARGEKRFKQYLSQLKAKGENRLSGEEAFDLFQTYGFPIEMTEELAQEAGITVDKEGYKKAYKAHQEKSRTASAGKFKGGLSHEDIEKETKLHTATHLMLAGLREVLGPHVHQAGSNITPQRLRFDFTHHAPLTPEEKKAVEDYVNAAIKADAKRMLEELPKEEAQKDPTIEGSFWDRYPEIVKVFTFKDDKGKIWSRELCGGPHVERTGTLGTFRIVKEQSSGKGVRRIRAVLE